MDELQNEFLTDYVCSFCYTDYLQWFTIVNIMQCYGLYIQCIYHLTVTIVRHTLDFEHAWV